MKCPQFEDLLDYCDRKVNESEAEAVAAHIASGCEQCAQSVAWYERVSGLAAGDDSQDPPPWVLNRAFRLFHSQVPTRTDHLGRLVAALVFDSLSNPVLAGMRLVETSNRQLLYRAGEYTVDLQINFFSPSFGDLIGQILRENESSFDSVANLPVHITREGKVVCETATSNIGEFGVHKMAYNEYDLSVETTEGVIFIPRVPIRPDEA